MQQSSSALLASPVIHKCTPQKRCAVIHSTPRLFTNAADKAPPTHFIPVVLPVAQQQKVGVIAIMPAMVSWQTQWAGGYHQALGYTRSAAKGSVLRDCGTNGSEQNVNTARAFQPLSQALAAVNCTAQIWDNTFFRAWT